MAAAVLHCNGDILNCGTAYHLGDLHHFLCWSPAYNGRCLSNIIMAALRSRCGHYIFALWFLSVFFFYSSPNLSGRRLDVYHTSTHGVALVRI